MRAPTPFHDRSQSQQLIIGGVVPMAIGALAGVLVGISAPAYWIIAGLAAVGAFLSGLEHPDGWDAADRGFLGGLIYGTALLLAHELANTSPKVSLGSAPAFLAVITTVAGTLLAAGGGRLHRSQRERAQSLSGDRPAAP